MPTQGNGSSAARQVNRGLMSTFVLASAVCGASLWVTWPWFGFPIRSRLDAWLTERREQSRRLRSLAQDPPVGVRLPEPSVVCGGPAPERGLSVVVFAGVPSSCCGASTAAFAETLGRRIRGLSPEAARTLVVIVYQASPELARKHAPSAARVGVAADEHGELARSYNAFFLPRAYVLRQGRLQWAQTEPGLPPETIAAAAWEFVDPSD